MSNALRRILVLVPLLWSCDSSGSSRDAAVDASAASAVDATSDAQGAGDSSTPTCIWGVDALLAEVGVASSERTDCGKFNSAQVTEVADALGCLLPTKSEHGTELTVNGCIDCSIPSTYVVTPEGKMYHVRMEADEFGDDLRDASVESCDDLVADSEDGVRCTGAVKLYSCQDKLVRAN